MQISHFVYLTNTNVVDTITYNLINILFLSNRSPITECPVVTGFSYKLLTL